MSIEGMEDLEKNLEALRDTRWMEQAMGKAIMTVRNAAVLECPVHYGELRRNIFADVRQEGDSTIGECWVNKGYAPFVEFGTGPKGQENHEGISPDYNPIYVQAPWWIHESQVDKKIAEEYGWFHIDTPEGRFYQCAGQKAHPFMYPALKNHEDEIVDGMKADFCANIKEVIK